MLVVLTAACSTESSAIVQEAHDCEGSVWAIGSAQLLQNESVEQQIATSNKHCLLDGRVVADEFRQLGPQGGVIFRGVGFEVESEDGSFIRTLWIMVGDDGYTNILGNRVGDEQYNYGAGFDGAGGFHERSTTYFSENDTIYNFVMDRSFDEGRTWRSEFNNIYARKIDNSLPALPDAMTPSLAETTARIDDSGLNWQPILDGFAAVAFSENEEGHDILHYASEYAAPSRWRVASWNIETGYLEFTTVNITPEE